MDPRLLVLCFGNFMIGTGTLIVPGMLPAIAQGLGVSVPVAAQLITAFAFTVCVTAPPLAGLTARFDRRSLLVAVQLLFAAGHLASAYATDLHALMILRVLSSVGAALFTAQAASTAALLVPGERRGSAIAFVFLGWSIASVVGMPLGAYVSETLGWPAGFAMVGAGSLIAAGAVHFAIPRGLMITPMGRAMWASLFRNRGLVLTVAVTGIQAAAQFTLLSFLVPSIKALFGASPETVSLMLVVLGVTGVIGNVIGARLIDRVGAPQVLLYGLGSMLAAHVLWFIAPGSLILLAAVLVLWGLGCFSTNSAQQARLVSISPPHAPVSVALNTSGMYFGQAAGTAAGSAMLAAMGSQHGYALLTTISVPLFVASIALSLWIDRGVKREARKG
ncbi:MAG TPA: MFS transporter [Burkholderiales bacterium]|nr:MFS transporter [Burkholderiales bacterium]